VPFICFFKTRGVVAATIALLAAGAIVLPSIAQSSDPVRLIMETELGDVEIELYPDRAPITVANFLRYVDAGRYDGGRFHRAVRRNNQARSDVLIEVIQGGANRDREGARFDPIALERTRDTGLTHVDGALSMARSGPDSARSDFFVCIGDQPSLDFGGERNADGQGFAVFGRVVAGMDVVRQIHQSPTGERESLVPPIQIHRISRLN
jgi:peptidyl-prolyl cis-trans isomerase A (cyclophilin A)